MARLVLNRGLPSEQVFEIHDGATTIGRSPENDIFLAHGSLSRQHARIHCVGSRVTITDLGSKNGTSVNGRRIEQSELCSGDVLRLGSIECLFSLQDDSFAPDATRDIHTAFFRTTTLDFSDKSGEAVFAGPESSASAQLQILLQVSQILSLPEPIDRLLEKVLDLVFQILDIDRAAILLARGDPADQGALPPRVIRSKFRLVEGEPFYSQRIVDYVRQTGKAALFLDPKSDPRIDPSRSVNLQGICGSMCAPLKSKDSLMGVLYVDSLSVSRRLTHEDLDLLTAFANQAAIAIENAMLHAQVAEEAVLRNTLVRFFPPTTIQKIMESKETGLGVIEAEITALFCDISNFVSISSGMEPREVIDILNKYFRIVADVVFECEGTLEKYIGDAILAVWGAPYAHCDDADRAVRAAVQMQKALFQTNDPRLKIHIGLNTGRAASGNIGSDRYVQYATIGTATNLASRICTAARAGEILISEKTRTSLQQINYPIEECGRVRVKGHEEALELYRVRWDPA